MTIGGVAVSWWLQFLLVCLVLLGGGMMARWLWQGFWWSVWHLRWGRVQYWLRDRVAPLLEDDRIVVGKCETCWAENGGEGCDWAMCGCACHDEDELPPLPPERSWEQMTHHQLPLEAQLVGELERQGWFDADVQARLRAEYEARHSPERERRPPWWESFHRAQYAALDLEYPSGLMARVREAAQ